MTSIETITELKVGEIFDSNGKGEIVTKVVHEDGKLARFKTIRREDDGAILELGYSVDGMPKKINQLFCGIHYGNNNHPPFNPSERYFELDKFLREMEK